MTRIPPILVDATVADLAPDTIINTATVSGGGSAPASASDGGGTSGLANVSITKTADPTTVQSGGTVTFTLNVANAGPSSALNVMVSDPIDLSSFSDVSVDSSQGTCDATVSCSLDTIVDNGSATITITATVKAGASTLTNNASVSSTTPDPDSSDNSASAAINVITSADLAIVKTGAATNPDQGTTTSYTLTVSNNGPNTAAGVVVNDSLPSQFTATAAGGGGFDCTLPGGPGGTVVCTLRVARPDQRGTRADHDHRHGRGRHRGPGDLRRGDGDLEHRRSRPDEQHRHLQPGGRPDRRRGDQQAGARERWHDPGHDAACRR